MKILLTGGAGYIGSITNRYLQSLGYQTVIFDNLSTGHKEAVGNTPLIIGDITSSADVDSVFRSHSIDAVLHFAAKTLPGESMEKPDLYYETNLVGSIRVLEAMKKYHCRTIVFSSSCSVYGIPTQIPVTEDTPKNPISVYAETKAMFEDVLARYASLGHINYASLRYFNACGATIEGDLGEDHTPESHIIPNAILTALGKKKEFVLYGIDYATSDGTCLRDYIHVLDLATAHTKALEFIQKNKQSVICNLGSMKGYTNREILTAIETVSGKSIPVRVAQRRPGDPDAVYADASKAREILGWEPTHSDLHSILQSAYTWHSMHPEGYKTPKLS